MLSRLTSKQPAISGKHVNLATLLTGKRVASVNSEFSNFSHLNGQIQKPVDVNLWRAHNPHPQQHGIVA